jgi:hypothetical protein
MSETHRPHHHEQLAPRHEQEQPVETHQQHERKHHEPARHELREKTHEIAHAAKQEAVSSSEYASLGSEKEQPHGAHVLANAELKQMAVKRTLTSVRKRMSAPERAFSRVVHQPAVNAVSDITARTVARPSGIAMGGLFAFVGTSAVLYICKRYGYTYNFLMFAMLFAAGFCLGLFVELLWWSMRGRRRA